MGAACGDGAARGAAGARRLRRRASGWRSRWSTTSSTSTQTPPRSARPPARTRAGQADLRLGARASTRARAARAKQLRRRSAHAALDAQRRCADAAAACARSADMVRRPRHEATTATDASACSTAEDHQRSRPTCASSTAPQLQAAGRRAARLRARLGVADRRPPSSNLGTVELTIALHYVFNTPDDRLVWDVGHQTYPHKILTGRRERMATLRQLGGISGFPRATRASTTPSAPRIRRPRSRPRSAWRSRREAEGRGAPARSRSSATAR